MFNLLYKTEVTLSNLPLQWIPKIELYYPDLPQFPIMYVHFIFNNIRIIACPVVVNYHIHDNQCDATFLVLCNENPTQKINSAISNEIANRIGLSDQITLDTVISCCNGNSSYESLLTDLWQYIEKSYGTSIPFGRFYEEIYSIARFVSAWQPKTGRQSEMRMLYNFMSAFGEEVIFPEEWSHLEYYVTPTYSDVQAQNFDLFPKFNKLYSAMKKLYTLDFSNTTSIDSIDFMVMPRAWKQNKDDFITNVSGKYYSDGKINSEEKFYAEKLVDAFNRHAWRAAYYISAILCIEDHDYKSWSKQFFSDFYDSGSALKGYSEKVIACFLQQGFGKDEIIPIDTWIETFYRFPLGIKSRTDFYNNFSLLGKLERVIWLASQSNKTNMRDFFDILWCQRYGTIGNTELRGINPLACYLCKLKSTCVGLSQIESQKVFVGNNTDSSSISSLPVAIKSQIDFVCSLEHDVPKKIYKKSGNEFYLIDEFSGYLMTTSKTLPPELISKGILTVHDFIYSI